MQFTTDKKELVSKMNKIKFASSNLVEFTSKNNIIYAITSNDEIEAKTIIQESLRVEKESIYSVSSFIFSIIDKLPEGEINFNFEEAQLIIKSINGEYVLNYVDNTRFKFADIKDELSNTIIINDPINIFKKSSISLAKNSHVSSGKNKIFTGVNIKTTTDNIYVQSSDTFRVSQTKLIKDYDMVDTCDIIIAGYGLSKAISNLGDKDIKMQYDTKLLLIKSNDTEYKIRLIEGVYPDLNKFIPEKENYFNNIVLNKNEVLSALERTSIFDEGDNNFIKLKFDEDEKTLEINKKSSIGDAVEIVNVAIGIKSFEIAVNGSFLKDAIKSFNTKVIELRLFGEYKPILIVSEEEPELTQLVLPVRI